MKDDGRQLVKIIWRAAHERQDSIPTEGSEGPPRRADSDKARGMAKPGSNGENLNLGAPFGVSAKSPSLYNDVVHEQNLHLDNISYSHSE